MNVRSSAIDEEGITLVELLIVIFVSTLFLGLLAVLFSNGLSTQRQATARDTATGKALVVSESLQSSIRNATAVSVAGSGARVDAVVILPGGGFECRAWALDAGGALRYSAGAVARGTDVGSWKPLMQGARGTLAAGAAFAADGARGIDVGIAVTVGDETARVTDGVTAQAVATADEVPTCW